MDNNFVPYLCGGILFSFLIELSNDTAQNFYKVYASQKAISQKQIMENLIRAITPNYSYDATSNSFKKNVSEYRSCKSDGGKIIPFNLDSTRTEFDRCVEKQYEDVLERMTKFTAECFPTWNNTSGRILVERTLILIRDDSSIGNDTPFFIQPSGSPISKEELLKKEDFNFQSFLVGTWHYIITKSKNENGKQTFEKLFPKYDGKERKLDTNCLESYAHAINVTYNEISKEPLPEKNSESQDIAEPSKTDRNKKIYVKEYYRGSLLDDDDEKAILSDNPAILDLNENPDIPIKNCSNSAIYKITTDFQVEAYFLSLEEEIIRLHFSIGSSSISGTTSLGKWISRSKLNEMRFRKKYPCTAWFRLIPCNEEYSAEFLLIGRIME